MLKEYAQIDENGYVLEKYVFDIENGDILPKDCRPLWHQTVRFYEPRYNDVTKNWEESADAVFLQAENERIKTNMKAIFSKNCQESILLGFECEVNGTVYHFAYDQETQLNFQDTYLLFENNMVNTIMWSAQKDNEKVRLSLGKALFMKVYLTGVKHKNNCLSYYHDTLLPLLQNATTIEETKTISWQSENINGKLLVLDENNTIEKKLQSIDATQTELDAQKEYNVYMESTVLELADMMLMGMM